MQGQEKTYVEKEYFLKRKGQMRDKNRKRGELSSCSKRVGAFEKEKSEHVSKKSWCSGSLSLTEAC